MKPSADCQTGDQAAERTSAATDGLQSCLSVFAVSAWANDTNSLDLAERAIDSYLASFRIADRRSALKALQAANRNMPSDSHAAQEIKARIEDRIIALSRSRRRPARPGGESATRP